MKQIILVTIVFFCAVIGQSQTANLTIKITNIEDIQGNISIALFKNAENFPSGGECFVGKVLPVESADFVYVLKEIPLGTYAIAISQDVNDNGKQDTNWIGIPKEPFGFSNNAKGKMGPPKFEDAKFELKEDSTLEIALRKI